jgi:hypothetical protein
LLCLKERGILNVDADNLSSRVSRALENGKELGGAFHLMNHQRGGSLAKCFIHVYHECVVIVPHCMSRDKDRDRIDGEMEG